MMRPGSSLGGLCLLSLSLAIWMLNPGAVKGSKASCSICGQGCLDACGTEAFRPCCLSYNRKRSSIGSQMSDELSVTEASNNSQEGRTSPNGAQKTTMQLKELKKLRQLYASLFGVIDAKSPSSAQFHVRKQQSSGGKWNSRNEGSPVSSLDMADSSL